MYEIRPGRSPAEPSLEDFSRAREIDAAWLRWRSICATLWVVFFAGCTAASCYGLWWLATWRPDPFHPDEVARRAVAFCVVGIVTCLFVGGVINNLALSFKIAFFPMLVLEERKQ